MRPNNAVKFGDQAFARGIVSRKLFRIHLVINCKVV
jgi:hypothetical protein